LVREGIGIQAKGAQMLQHLAHHALAGGNVAGEADDVFAGPATAHKSKCALRGAQEAYSISKASGAQGIALRPHGKRVLSGRALKSAVVAALVAATRSLLQASGRDKPR